MNKRLSPFYGIQLFLGRNYARVLRNFPHAIKRSIFYFPPVKANGSAQKLVVMATPKTFLESLWTAYGWMRLAGEPFSLLVLIDGAVSESMRADFARCFVGGEIREAREFIGDSLRSHRLLNALVQDNIYGRKVGALLVLSQQTSFFYSDADVVPFAAPTEMLEALRAGRIVYNEEMEASYDPLVEKAFRAEGVEMVRGFNSGLMTLPRGSLDLELAERIIVSLPPEHFHYYIEQGLIAGLCFKQGATPLPSTRYGTSWKGMWFWQEDIESYDGLVCRHFCGPVRHLMYGKGYPRLRARLKNLPCCG